MPRPNSAAAPAPGVPADLRADLGLTPKFYSWDGSFSGSFTSDYSDVSVDVSGGSGTVSVTVRPSIPPTLTSGLSPRRGFAILGS